jgi:hypothetical protein
MIIRELGPIICELGYGDLLNDREKSIDGRLININCTEYRTEEPIKDIYVS